MLREAWKCDCDGVVRTGDPSSQVSGHLHAIEMLTGFRPHTCPWRAYYDADVREVVHAVHFEGNGNLAAAIGDDPPQKLVEGISVFLGARDAVLAEERKIAAAKKGTG